MLREYQEEIRNHVVDAFEKYRSVMVQMPTGTGKTVVLASIVEMFLRGNSTQTVLIVAHRKELVEQIRETLKQQCFPSLISNSIRVHSIQWLSRRIDCVDFVPSLVIIDEAHHALAKTYKVMWQQWQGAKFLGLTATPCRLNKHGFTDLFDVLLQSWSHNRFIAEGWLSLYDYMSVRVDSEEWRMVNSLKKRGADGDFSLREMSEKLDVRPSIERLCDTVLRYARDKKGIVYAIDIQHAEHITEYYREHGINAVVISSKTPPDERQMLIGRFKESVILKDKANGSDRTNMAMESIQVLVNVDLFGEGFDCPDVEFIQLARPTLSLAKYLQQVGRGMRVFDGKKYCLILDNVGLYRLFGLPSDDRDWLAMFEGSEAGKGNLKRAEEKVLAAYSICHDTLDEITTDERTDLIIVMAHDGQRNDLEAAYKYRILRNAEGLTGVVDKDGKEVLPCIYNKVELKLYGIAKLYSRRKVDRESPWIDLQNGIRFRCQPKIERYGFLGFCTTDGLRLYPRVRTKLMDETCFVTPAALSHGIDDGLRFRNFYIPPSMDEPQIYTFKDKMDSYALFESADGLLYFRNGLEAGLHSVSLDEWKEEKIRWTDRIKDFEDQVKRCGERRIFPYHIKVEINHGYKLSDYNEVTDIRITRNGQKAYNTFAFDMLSHRWKSKGSYTEIFPPAYGIRVVRNWEGKYLLRTSYFEKFSTEEDPKFDFAELQDEAYLYIQNDGNEYYVDLESKVCFEQKPKLVRIGFMLFQKDGDLHFPFDYRLSGSIPYRRGEIAGGEDVCFIGKNMIVLKDSSSIFYIRQRYSDGKRFIVSKNREEGVAGILYDLYYDGKNPVEIQQRKP